MPLRAAALTVGSDPGCDVVLSDPGLEPVHFTMRATGAGGAALTARGGAVRIDDEIEVAPGFRAAIAGSAAIEAAGVRMDLALAPAAAPAPRRGRRVLPRRGALLPVLVCAGLLLGAQGAGLSAGDVDRREDGGRALAAEAVAAPRPAGIPAPAASASAALEAADIASPVAAELAARGLTGVEVRQSGRLVALEGRVAAADRPAWRGFQRWFDGAHPGAVLMAEKVAVLSGEEAHPPFPAIQSVWTLGGAPYAMIGGSRVRVGNALPGGWTLTAIGAASVTLRREGRDYRLDLIDPAAGGAEPAP